MKKTVYTLQYLRWFAASLVVIHHTRNPLPWLFPAMQDTDLGVFGVSIFFMISGFIMYLSGAESSPVDFARRRIIRVVPLYWIFTTLALFREIAKGLLSADLLARYGMSLGFVPHYMTASMGVFIWPILVPGWTLNFEMFFYLLFALGLATRRVLPFCAAAITLLFCAGKFYPQSNAAWVTYTSSLMFEFLAGMVLGALFKARGHGVWLLIQATLSIVLAIVLWHQAGRVAISLLGLGLLSLALALEVKAEKRPAKWLLLLGDSSYALYLSHVFLIGGLMKVVQKIPLQGWPQLLAAFAFTLTVCSLVSIAVHLYVEKPVTRWVGALLGKRREA